MIHEIKDGLVYLYNSYEYKEDIKKILGRRWNPDEKAWTIPYNKKTIEEANQILNVSIKVPREKKIPVIEFNPRIKYLYKHQRDSVKVGLKSPFMADLSEPGTGKTLTAIELILQRDKWPILIICPKSIMEVVWKEELEKIKEELGLTFQTVLLNGSSAKVKNALHDLYRDGYPNFIAIINYDKVDIVLDHLYLFEWDQIILDESTKIKSPTARRSKAILKLAKKSAATHRHIMTGTLAPNGLLDAFNQMRFLSPDLFGESYYAFRQSYFMQQPWDQYNWYPKQDSYDRFRKTLEGVSIQHKKRECADLPPLVEEKRVFSLSPDQHKAYQQMKKEALLVLKDLTIVAPFKITQLMKLRQICSGFLYLPEETRSENYETLSNNKFFELMDLLEEIEDKVIIFCHFNHSIQYLSKAIDNSVAFLGSDLERQQALSKFKNTDKFKYLIANPASAGHGLNLQYCSNIIYYELDYNLENYLQSIDRINRIGQKNKMTVFYLIAEATLEGFIFKKLKLKQDINKKIDVSELRDAL